jgi:hypothetical protein
VPVVEGIERFLATVRRRQRETRPASARDLRTALSD